MGWGWVAEGLWSFTAALVWVTWLYYIMWCFVSCSMTVAEKHASHQRTKINYQRKMQGLWVSSTGDLYFFLLRIYHSWPGILRKYHCVIVSMTYYKPAVIPILTHWSYRSIGLSQMLRPHCANWYVFLQSTTGWRWASGSSPSTHHTPTHRDTHCVPNVATTAATSRTPSSATCCWQQGVRPLTQNGWYWARAWRGAGSCGHTGTDSWTWCTGTWCGRTSGRTHGKGGALYLKT